MKFASCVCQCLTTLLGDFMIRFQFWITFGMIQWSNDPPWSSLISICCGGFHIQHPEPAPWRTRPCAMTLWECDVYCKAQRIRMVPGWSSRNPSNTCRWYMVKPCFTSWFTMIMIHDVLYTSGWITMTSLESCLVREIIPKCPDFSYFQMS